MGTVIHRNPLDNHRTPRRLISRRKQRQECPRSQRWPLPPFNKPSYPGIPGLGDGLGTQFRVSGIYNSWVCTS